MAYAPGSGVPDGGLCNSEVWAIISNKIGRRHRWKSKAIAGCKPALEICNVRIKGDSIWIKGVRIHETAYAGNPVIRTRCEDDGRCCRVGKITRDWAAIVCIVADVNRVPDRL